MEQIFKDRKTEFIGKDSSIIDIEVMDTFGNRWGGSATEMLLRIIYKGEKRLITTVREDSWEEELSQLIYKTRAHFRQHKLERILDGV